MRYETFLSPAIQEFLLQQATPYPGNNGLRHIGSSGGLETKASMEFLLAIYREIRTDLQNLLDQREKDRKFLDERTRAMAAYNAQLNIPVTDSDYKTILGLQDQNGRVVAGPLKEQYWRCNGEQNIAPLPQYLNDNHVTLFGPPGSAKMCINAMNAYHRELPGESSVVKELLKTHTSIPKWGADDEDSKTPMRADLIAAGENLSRCFDRDMRAEDNNKLYELQSEKLALPIKRFPGLALPCTFLFLDNEALPLHLYDFALHLYKNWARPEALVFYVPKLENEEEARYIRKMIVAAETLINKIHPTYKMGTVRLMIVLENPRAVFRTHEIMDELYPYFAGASLGWHDFLASTARLFKEDSNYRIPTKADPDIVIKYIKASHNLLADVVGPRGGIKVGGMYGILPTNSDLSSDSFQLTLKGYFRDVFTQMKRGLDGFWVAHPDFVRLGLAMVEAWKFYKNGDPSKIESLVRSLLKPAFQEEVLQFVFGPDVASLDPADARFGRALIVSDLKQSEVLANNDPEEVRFNVFQTLQYLADWLCGNGCVALPGEIAGTSVRIMDDLATAERSRWEVWHEIHHGRFALADFLTIAFEEFHFIQKDLSNSKKIVQVKWTDESAKWYPVAFNLMVKLMTDPNPAEFATELLLPFTMDAVRSHEDPWELLCKLDSAKFSIRSDAQRFMNFFQCCGNKNWADDMSRNFFADAKSAEKLILTFSKQDIIEAARFHGNIGEARRSLDPHAANEQARVLEDSEATRLALLKLGAEYQAKYGIKFLISARGRSAAEILDQLQLRIKNPLNLELQNAREALIDITLNRMKGLAATQIGGEIEKLRLKHKVDGISIALSNGGEEISTLALGKNRSGDSITPEHRFQIASLSKSIAAAFIVDHFAKAGIALSTSVNALLSEHESTFRLQSAEGLPPDWADQVTVEHLLRHEALNLHYVNGSPGIDKIPNVEDLLNGNDEYEYQPVRVISEPGSKFKYSGAGFLVLEHLLEFITKRSSLEMLRPYLARKGLHEITFNQYNEAHVAYCDAILGDGSTIMGGRKHFPAFAAGALGTARAIQAFVSDLGRAYLEVDHNHLDWHNNAVRILHGIEKGSLEFMHARMGLGVFVVEAGLNRLALHQGANDGYRCLYLHCFAGPDAGKGFTILSNGELNAVELIAKISRRLLEQLQISGIDYEILNETFDPSGLKQEELVNRGYKELLLKAFAPSLPEPIPRRGKRSAWAAENKLSGARILSCSDQRFALAENLISPFDPVFEFDLYGSQGKIMDSWESARHSSRGVEELLLQLAEPSAVSYIFVSTQFHLGNQVPEFSVEGRRDPAADWECILPRTSIDGHARKYLRSLCAADSKFVQIRVLTYPDGGLARLALFDSSLKAVDKNLFLPPSTAASHVFKEAIPQSQKPLSIPLNIDPAEVQRNWTRALSDRRFNLASAALGATIVSASNEHYSPASQVISPFPPLNMFDGFESARSRVPNHNEECVLRLGRPARIQEIEFDFGYFVNNNPRAIAVEYQHKGSWRTLIAKTEVKAFAGNSVQFAVDQDALITELRILVYPDGGINRVRVY